ncbi:ABC transporter ATP-binding domain protein (plasmid) [Blastomonas sp. RAC04]|nr:ABC transporter ATP-binding domain protein [Blastomonas sp. RAC04]
MCTAIFRQSRPPSQRMEESKILRAAQCRIKADAFCYVSEHRACSDGIVLHGLSANERLTLRRLAKTQEQVECGRLPGTVSTKEANDFTHSNFQIQIAERNRFSEGLRQIPCFKNSVTS